MFEPRPKPTRWPWSTIRSGASVLGILTEAHALRRYTEELDQRRRELAGEL